MKATKEKIAVMQAYCDGEAIEYTQNNQDNWKEVINPSWNWGGSKYRVKPQLQYQPFDYNSARNLIGRLVKSKYFKDNKFTGMITSVYENNIVIGDITITYKKLFEECLFLDDSICGELK